MSVSSLLRACALALATLTLGGVTGCLGADDFASDDIEDGFRESLYLLSYADLQANPDGSGLVDFQYRYGLGIRDDEGIEEVRWTYQLVDANERVLASVEQRMRDPQPEKTQILVEGKRTRQLEIPAGMLRSGEDYVLWFTLEYRGERLSEYLHAITEGERYEASSDDLPVVSRQ